MVASLTPLPVIGVPVRASSLDGMDSLLSIVQVEHNPCNLTSNMFHKLDVLNLRRV